MPRPAFPRPSKLRNASDDETDVNRAGGWSRERLIGMGQAFRAAMQRALLASRPQATLPPRKRRALDRK
jgi:hypothetical protein